MLFRLGTIPATRSTHRKSLIFNSQPNVLPTAIRYQDPIPLICLSHLASSDGDTNRRTETVGNLVHNDILHTPIMRLHPDPPQSTSYTRPAANYILIFLAGILMRQELPRKTIQGL